MRVQIERLLEDMDLGFAQDMSKHDSYHCGQIHMLRALQGIATEW